MDFIIGKLFWMVTAPLNLFGFLFLFASMASLSHQRDLKKTGSRVCFTLSLCLLFLMVFPVGDWMLYPLENRFKASFPEKVDGILILGGDEDPIATEQHNQPVLRVSARRYIALADLAKRYPHARIVFTGGYPDNKAPTKLTNGDVAKKVMTILGLPDSRITIETESRTTFENARDSAALIQPKPDQNWILITSAYHMPRSIGAFRKFGWNVYAAPTDYLGSTNLFSYQLFDLSHHMMGVHTALREYLGLLAYWITGKIKTPWPG